MITICLTYFKSLTLANLRAALYSVRQQDFSQVSEVIVFDNDTADAEADIYEAVHEQVFPVPVRMVSVKHGDATKTHSWSTNAAIYASATPWILFTRADYLLDFDLLKQFTMVANTLQHAFVTGRVVHLDSDIGDCEKTDWRLKGPRLFTKTYPHLVEDYMKIDAGVWMTTREAFDNVGGLCEELSAWGHSQTHFQWKLHKAGSTIVSLPDVYFYHPRHAAPRDIALAHEQVSALGLDLKEMWARYEGTSPY